MTFATSLRIVLATSVLAGSVFAVQAQGHAQEGRGVEQYKRDQAAHTAELKDKLNLSDNQQGAWEQYQAAMESDRPARQAHEARAEKPTLTDEQKAERKQQRDARKQAKEEARKAFYDQLTPAQQQVLDAEEKHGKSPRDRQQRAE